MSAQPIQLRKQSDPLYDLDAGISREVDGEYPCPVCGKPSSQHEKLGFRMYKDISGIPGSFVGTVLRELCDDTIVEEFER